MQIWYNLTSLLVIGSCFSYCAYSAFVLFCLWDFLPQCGATATQSVQPHNLLMPNVCFLFWSLKACSPLYPCSDNLSISNFSSHHEANSSQIPFITFKLRFPRDFKTFGYGCFVINSNSTASKCISYSLLKNMLSRFSISDNTIFPSSNCVHK